MSGAIAAARIFDQKYTVEGIETPVWLRIKDVIFVMEAHERDPLWSPVTKYRDLGKDVDAASHVVHRLGLGCCTETAQTLPPRPRPVERSFAGGAVEHAELRSHRALGEARKDIRLVMFCCCWVSRFVITPKLRACTG